MGRYNGRWAKANRRADFGRQTSDSFIVALLAAAPDGSAIASAAAGRVLAGRVEGESRRYVSRAEG
jgi:hypothetical protein